MMRYSTLGVGGCADAVVFPRSSGEVAKLVRALSEHAVPWSVIGRGSNIVVSDQGIAGVVLILGRQFASIADQGQTEDSVSGRHQHRVFVEAGCSLTSLIGWCVDQGLSGLESLVGIPASIGGAISMNAGAWGHEISEVLESVTVITREGNVVQRTVSADDFEYRRWKSRGDDIVVDGVFRLVSRSRMEIEERCRGYLQKRKEKQPQGVASAGSFFKNPPGHAAGRLIEEAGMKGYRVGGAMVSEKHANFLVNTGTATASDFLNLMRVVQEKVRDNSGIALQPEVKFVGRWE